LGLGCNKQPLAERALAMEDAGSLNQMAGLFGGWKGERTHLLNTIHLDGAATVTWMWVDWVVDVD